VTSDHNKTEQAQIKHFCSCFFCFNFMFSMLG